MPESLHRFLLERIAQQSRPVFQGPELASFPEAEGSLWLNAGVLKRADAPRTIHKVCDDGIRRELEVFSHGNAFFGRCTDPDEPLPALELSEIELSRYRFSRSGLAHAIAKANGFDAIAFDGNDSGLFIGDLDGRAFFLLQPVPAFDQLLPQLLVLSDQLAGQPGVVLSPVAVAIPIKQRRRVAELGFQLAALGNDRSNPFAVRLQTIAAAPESDESEVYVMQHTGASWTINYLGQEFTVNDVLGARYIAHLLSHPGFLFDASQLKNFMSSSELDRENTNDSTTEAERAIEATTPENLIRLKNRYRELQGERKRSEGDPLAIQEIDDEMEPIHAELKRVTTREGTIRREGGTLDKDRKSVSNAINQRFYKAVGERCPACYRYFRNRIDLGFKNMFIPAEGEVWKVRFPQK